MRGRSHSSTPMSLLIISMLSFLSCFYIAGRLWQDAQTRVFLINLLNAHTGQGQGTISVEEKLKVIDCKDQQKRLASLEVEIASAKIHGFIPMHASMTNKTANGKRFIAVIGIMTEFGHMSRRDSIRNTWMTAGTTLEKLEAGKGIVIRFIIGRSASKGDSSDKLVADENDKRKDFFILENHVEAPEKLPDKTKSYFKYAVETWDAEFYIKANDDVFINVEKLRTLLVSHLDKPKVYIGCMKSGEVFSNPIQRWYEPEWWKFGEKKSYFRHASGEAYIISRVLAQFISVNSAILKAYAHEDVSVGAWMIGLNMEHVDEKGLCCAGSTRGSICATA